MNRIYTNLSLVLGMVLTCSFAIAQDWPKTITTSGGDKIKVYQPQPESYSNNILKSKSAVSVITGDKTEPVFGMFWSVAETTTDGKTVHVQSLQVTDIKFPADIDDDKAGELKSALQSELGRMGISLQKQELESALNTNQQETKLASNLSNTPPKVIYTNKASTLVLIDGAPKWQMNNDWGVEVVVNSPFTIVKNQDGRYYLYGGKKWYTASSATGPYNYTTNVPSNLSKVEEAVNNAAQSNNTASNTNTAAVPENVVPEIIVSTEPAELIQSNGEANFSPVEGTSLLYVKNSSNDIFMDVNSQQYYVLLSGRWYKSSSLNSKWEYIASNKLPADFAKITEGSPKDNVLASVAGTEAADDAVMNAQVPQTAKVDRSTASANVAYDGDPEFARIDGTRLQYAINSSVTVLRYNNRYYSVDNGVWFESGRATGPWVVSTARPDEVELIPPSYPVYNVKYVYIYDVTPEYVYMGYTPGYLNTFVYGPTIVYGTGYYYRPWYRTYYYPRPYTWGFAVNYTPWYGWGIGYGFSSGWFNCGFGYSSWNYWSGGWWGGPSIYRPAFCGTPYRSYGYYGSRSYGYYGYGGGRNNINININYSNNIYRYRRDVVTHDNRVWNGGRGNNGYANNNRRDNQGNRGGNNWNNNNRNGGNNDRFNNNRNNNNSIRDDRNRITTRPENNAGNDRGRLIDRYNNRSNNDANNDRNRFNNRSNDNNSGNNGGRLIDRYNRNNNDANNNRIRSNDGSNNNNPNFDRNRFSRPDNNNNSNEARPARPQQNGNMITPRQDNNGGQFQRRSQSQPNFGSDRPSVTQPRDGGGGYQRPQIQSRERSSSPSSSQPQFGGERRAERRSDGGGGGSIQQGGRSNNSGGGDRGSSGGGDRRGGGRRG